MCPRRGNLQDKSSRATWTLRVASGPLEGSCHDFVPINKFLYPLSGCLKDKSSGSAWMPPHSFRLSRCLVRDLRKRNTVNFPEFVARFTNVEKRLVSHASPVHFMFHVADGFLSISLGHDKRSHFLRKEIITYTRFYEHLFTIASLSPVVVFLFVFFRRLIVCRKKSEKHTLNGILRHTRIANCCHVYPIGHRS